MRAHSPLRWSKVCALSLVLVASCSDSSGDGGDPTDATTTDGATADTLGTDAAIGDTLTSDGAGKDTLGTDTATTGDAADATPPVETNKVLYVGGSDGKISLFSLDTTSGALTSAGEVAAGNFPSFLAFDVAHLHLYAVLEGSNKVASFSIAKGTGALTKLNEVSSPGGPTHVSVDRTGKYAMVANYGGGTALVFGIGADGALGAQTDSKSPGTNSHQFITDPSNAFAFVPNKGSDTVSQYVFDATKGTLTANATARLTVPGGSGPRHLAFHPDGKHA
ncbi:MAG: beta-propeller fold lactonase family protein, partial [Polyangiales bacterium]